MSDVVHAANPLPFLLDEEAHGDHQATEAVFATFNADLGFFEARILGACMSAGARVCVLADASVWAPDPYAAKHAGRDYHVGLAATTGAFHPKVVALVGPKRAVVAVGSGNLTMGGWQHNAETWTVLRGDTSRAPAAMAAAADALDDLLVPGLDKIASAALERTSTELRNLLDGCSDVVSTGHQILSSRREPIVDQIPSGRAKEAWLYAPFLDPKAHGVAAVLERLRPHRVTVMVQPGWTVLNPVALEETLKASGAEWAIVEDNDVATGAHRRYRHGKLIEWVTLDGDRLAVTGSPNLSYAALVAAPKYANVEVAVLSPLGKTMFPPAVPVAINDVPHVQISTVEEQSEEKGVSPGGLLLAAMLVPQGLSLTLSRPLDDARFLERSLRTDAPDTWAPLGVIPAGTSTPVLKTTDPVPANSRVRLSAQEDGSLRHGPLVYVTDPGRVQRRSSGTARSRTAATKPVDLWGQDLSILNAFSADLAALAADVAATKPPKATSVNDGVDHREPRTAHDTDTAPWLWLQDQASTHHGPHLAAFALGMPAPPDVGDAEDLAWVDQLISDKEIALATDTAETVDADHEITPDPSSDHDVPNHTQDHDDVRRARRSRMRTWSDKVNTVPLTSSLIVLRLALVWWSAGDWDEDDHEPHEIVDQMLRKIAARTDQNQAELEASVASLGVVALKMVSDRIDPGKRNPTTLRFVGLRDDLAYLGLGAQEDLVAAYCSFLRRPSGWPLDPDDVMDDVRSWLDENPFADATDAMEEAGYVVTRLSPRLLRVDGSFGNPEPIAVRAVDLASHTTGPVGAWGVSTNGSWAFAAWHRPDLVRAVHTGQGPTRWRHQRLPILLGPVASSGPDGLRYLVQHGPLMHEFPEGRALLAELGLSSPDPGGPPDRDVL